VNGVLKIGKHGLQTSSLTPILFLTLFTAHTNLFLTAPNAIQTNRNYTAQSLILLLKLKTKEI